MCVYVYVGRDGIISTWNGFGPTWKGLARLNLKSDRQRGEKREINSVFNLIVQTINVILNGNAIARTDGHGSGPGSESRAVATAAEGTQSENGEAHFFF